MSDYKLLQPPAASSDTEWMSNNQHTKNNNPLMTITTKTKTEIPIKCSSTFNQWFIAQHRSASCFCEISNKVLLLFSIHSMPFAKNQCERHHAIIQYRGSAGSGTYNLFESNGFVSADWEWNGRCMFESCSTRDKRNEIENNCSGCVLRQSHFGFSSLKLKRRTSQVLTNVLCTNNMW